MCRRGGRGGGLQARCSLYGFVHGGCMADTPRHLHSTVVQHRLCTVHLGRRKGWTMPACDSTSLLHHRHAARITATAINHATILISKPSQCTWRHGRQQQCAVCLAISSIPTHTHTYGHADQSQVVDSQRTCRSQGAYLRYAWTPHFNKRNGLWDRPQTNSIPLGHTPSVPCKRCETLKQSRLLTVASTLRLAMPAAELNWTELSTPRSSIDSKPPSNPTLHVPYPLNLSHSESSLLRFVSLCHI